LLGEHLHKIAEKPGQMPLPEFAKIFAEIILPPKDLPSEVLSPQQIRNLNVAIDVDKAIVLDILAAGNV